MEVVYHWLHGQKGTGSANNELIWEIPDKRLTTGERAVAKKSVIIIGAGLAGLSCGCYAQMNGYDSHIFEHHAVPGGVAAAWKRQGYLIDGGIHFMMGCKPGTGLHRLLDELGAGDPALYADMTSYGRFIHQPSGIDLQIGGDPDVLASELKRRAPEDARAIDRLIRGVKAFCGHDASSFGLSQPPELGYGFGQIKDLWQMRSALRYFVGTYARPISDLAAELKTPWLRDFFCSLFLPEFPAWFIMMVLSVVTDRQCGFLAGGCLDFVLAVEKRYKNLGGQTTYKATVEKILVEDNRAVGIRTVDGSEYRADYVISTGDSAHTIFNLLEGKYTNEKIRKRHETWPLTRPFLTVSYGVAREFSADSTFSTIVLADPVTVGAEKVRMLFLRILNYSGRFAPPGKSVIQVEIEADFDYWFNLQARDRPTYDREKKRLADEFMTRLEEYYPGLMSQVEVVDVATPYTTWRYTLNRKGAWGAWLMTTGVIKERIERKLPGLKNFYMAGQWVSFGGVAPTLYSGRHAIQLLCHDEKRRFVTQRG
jgi:phytoene dehydrogenase-like protein